jgi:hypothetical protein
MDGPAFFSYCHIVLLCLILAYQKSMKSVAGHKDAPPEQCRGKWQAPCFGIRGGDGVYGLG